MSDANRDKVFDNLDPILARAADTEKIPVLIMARRPQDLDLLEQAVGPLEVKYRYTVVPAMAASVTKAQVEALAKESACRHIEYDAEVRIAMDGANRWFGAAQARADYGVTGAGVVAAIIDTGIDANHVDLAGGKVIAWNDWVSGRTAPYDDNGHGTHVAGIVAGSGTANPNYIGVAPGAALIGLKVLNGSGSGSLSNVTAAVDWAVTNKDRYNIKIISMCQA
jgi:serine protease AprX